VRTDFAFTFLLFLFILAPLFGLIVLSFPAFASLLLFLAERARAIYLARAFQLFQQFASQCQNVTTQKAKKNKGEPKKKQKKKENKKIKSHKRLTQMSDSARWPSVALCGPRSGRRRPFARKFSSIGEEIVRARISVTQVKENNVLIKAVHVALCGVGLECFDLPLFDLHETCLCVRHCCWFGWGWAVRGGGLSSGG
jgi:hypothetical protein